MNANIPGEWFRLVFELVSQVFQYWVLYIAPHSLTPVSEYRELMGDFRFLHAIFFVSTRVSLQDVYLQGVYFHPLANAAGYSSPFLESRAAMSRALSSRNYRENWPNYYASLISPEIDRRRGCWHSHRPVIVYNTPIIIAAALLSVIARCSIGAMRRRYRATAARRSS